MNRTNRRRHSGSRFKPADNFVRFSVDRRRFHIGALAGILVWCLLSGAPAVASPAAPPSDASDGGASPPAYVAAQGAFTQVFTDGGFGMGGVVDDFIITSAHVVAGAGRVTVQFPDRSHYPAVIAAMDAAADVAALVVPPEALRGRPRLALRSAPPDLGEEVFTYGGTLNLFPILAVGRVTHCGDNLYLTDAPIQPGYSGAPLCSYRGDVVGLTVFRHTTLTGVTPASRIAPVLAAARAAAPTPPTGEVPPRTLPAYSPHRLAALAASEPLRPDEYVAVWASGAEAVFTTPVSRLSGGRRGRRPVAVLAPAGEPAGAFDWELGADPHLLPLITVYVSAPARGSVPNAGWKLVFGNEDGVGLSGDASAARGVRRRGLRRVAADMTLHRDGVPQSPVHVWRSPDGAFTQYDFAFDVFQTGEQFTFMLGAGGSGGVEALTLSPTHPLIRRLRRDGALLAAARRPLPGEAISHPLKRSRP